jgi:ATP-binding cassette subfamily B protein
MTSTVPGRTDWLTLPPFAGLSAGGRERLLAEARPCRFHVGEDLSSAGSIADRVLVLHEGEARLLAERDGRPFTLERLGPGAIVGLVSLLRAEGIEAVSAASDLLATAIPDTLMLELLLAEDGLRQWCGRHLWTAELHQLLLQREGAAAGRFDPSLWREKLERLRLRARGVLPSSDGPIALQEGDELLLASANVPDLAIGSVLAAAALPQPRPPLPLRLLALAPAPAAASTPDITQAAQAIVPVEADAGGLAQPSSLDLGQDRADRGLTLVRGSGPLEETLACFQMLGKLLELPYRRDAVDKILRDKMRRGQPPDLQLCGQIAAMLGLLVTGAKVPAASATRLITPCLVPWKEGFAIATASNAAGLWLASPAEGWVQLNPAQIAEQYPEGLELLLLERSIDTPEQTFGPGWFWPALKRYRGMLLQVLLASFVVQLFSLANPLLIQVIIDKVISQRSLDTLQILGMALVVVTLMEGVIGSLRTFLFTDTTNRIDLRLGAEVIDHLLRLPLGYFDKRPVGELGTRIAELEKIRNFLTGQALITLLDAAFSVIYIIVMAIYSWLLTIIALAVLPIQIGLTLLGAPLFRRQYRQAAEENARTQSHLVEVLTGIQTVKAQNVEMVSRWKWQELYARYISRTFEKTITGTFLNETSSVLQKLSQLLVLWVGATMVLKGGAHPGPADRLPDHQWLCHPAPAAALLDLAEHPGAESLLRAPRRRGGHPGGIQRSRPRSHPLAAGEGRRGVREPQLPLHSQRTRGSDQRQPARSPRHLHRHRGPERQRQEHPDEAAAAALLPHEGPHPRGRLRHRQGGALFPAPPGGHRAPGSPALLRHHQREHRPHQPGGPQRRHRRGRPHRRCP